MTPVRKSAQSRPCPRATGAGEPWPVRAVVSQGGGEVARGEEGPRKSRWERVGRGAGGRPRSSAPAGEARGCRRPRKMVLKRHGSRAPSLRLVLQAALAL